MNNIRRLVTAAAVGVAAVAGFATTVQAASPPQVTLTFRLTLTGNVSTHDIFLVTFPTNGAQFCGPCAGGRTYAVKLPRPRGTAIIPFHIDRESVIGCVPNEQGSASCPPENQHEFAKFNVRPTANQTFNAAFDYGSPRGPSVPATGADAHLITAAGLLASGTAIVALGIWPRRRSRPLTRR